jgi:urease subunit gamma/beta
MVDVLRYGTPIAGTDVDRIRFPARRYHPVMRMIPWEEERLVIFAAAELARRHRASGLRLNHPEAIAIICDAMLDAARAGGTYADVEAAGRAAVDPGDVLDGVRELLDEVRLEVLLGDGSRLIALNDPLGRGTPPDPLGPGALLIGDAGEVDVNTQRPWIELAVTSRSRRKIRISSHFPFHRVNQRLEFDRDAAAGYRLDVPAGGYLGWEPGETKTVRLVRYAGERGRDPEGSR